MKTIITGLLSTVYNLDKGKIAELIKDGEMSEEEQTEALRQILEINASHISTVKENAVKSVDSKELVKQGYNKAKAEIMTTFEDGLKSKFGVTTDKTGQDLIDFIVSEKSAKGTGEGLTDDNIKASRIYQDLEQNSRNALKKVEEDFQKQIQDITDGYAYEKTFSNVSTKSMGIFNGLNPILPANKEVADNQVNNFLATLRNGYKFEEQGDRIVVKDAEGKVKEDGHGNSVSFEDFVKGEASKFFEFKQNNGGSGSGNKGGQGGQGGGSNLIVPKTYEDLEKVMLDPNVSKTDKVNIVAEYEKAQKGVE